MSRFDSFGGQGIMEIRHSTSLFLAQLARVDRAGVPLADALSALADSAPRKDLRRAAIEAGESVDAGHGLAAGLAAFPHLFPPASLRLVEHGERSGDLAGALGAAAENAQILHDIRQGFRELAAEARALAAAGVTTPEEAERCGG